MTMSSSRLYPLFGNAASNESDDGDDVPLSSLANHEATRKKRPRVSREEKPMSSQESWSKATVKSNAVASEMKHSEEKESEERKHSEETKQQEKEQSKDTDRQSEETNVDRRRNIIHQLIQRQVQVTSRRPLPYPPAAHAKWSRYSSFNFGRVTAMAWDHVGVLLAIATTDRRVLVLDWDAVRVSRGQVEPMCTFSVPHVITTMQWDIGDYLAMTFRGTSKVRVYDVARVANGDGDCCTRLDSTFHTKSALALVCLPRRQWLVSYGDGLVLLFKCSRGNATIQWKWRDSRVFTRIQPLGTNTVLLTSDREWVALDWKHCTRTPFSSEKTPTISKSWNLGSVRALSLEQEQYCKWVSAEGWVMSVDLHRSTEKRILHGPPPLLIQTTPDETKKSSQFSQPLQAVAACATSSLVVWETVPQVTHILPHHDRRHVGGTLQVVRSPPRSLSVMDSYGRIVEIPMQHSINQVTLHPSNEWLVVATFGGQLQVWIGRKLPKRQRDSSAEETL
jgi:hypothetical protein